VTQIGREWETYEARGRLDVVEPLASLGVDELAVDEVLNDEHFAGLAHPSQMVSLKKNN